MIQIYGVPGSRAIRPLWALEELGVPYQLVPTNFATGDTRRPGYLKINPNGHIPALVDGDFKLFESMAINLYLAEKYGRGSLWPASEQDRARSIQWSFWAMTECEANLLEAYFNRSMLPPAERDEAKAKEAEDELQAPLRVLDDHLAGREYLLGSVFTIADLNVASVLQWTRIGKIGLGAFPRVEAWLARCTGRPALKAARSK
jgi:glutathione S-transferase